MFKLSKDTRTMNRKISDMVGCNVEGRVEYTLCLLERGDISNAKIELKGLLMFIKEV